MYARWAGGDLKRKLAKPFVHILFGARQTGKSTLLGSILPPDAVRIDLSDPGERARLLADPSEFVRLCKALPPKPGGTTVFVDEAQTVPSVFDSIQHLYDGDKKRWRFVLCGSSARRLRLSGANLLPGRSILHHLYPLTMAEHPSRERRTGPSPLPFPFDRQDGEALFPSWGLEERLAFGSLPGIVCADPEDRGDLLSSYAVAYLEEEIRREALVRDWGAFLRFLRLAATESGNVLNYAAVSREAGISIPTVKSYYQLLEDLFVGFRVDSHAGSPRKNLLSTPKFLLFDTGVRHAAAGLSPSVDTVRSNPGPIFEQWVGAELWKRAGYLGARVHYLRTRDGAEIDFIVEHGGRLVPVEVKWTERPGQADVRHLKTFLAEHPKQATHGFVVCRCPRALALADNITAIPWEAL